MLLLSPKEFKSLTRHSKTFLYGGLVLVALGGSFLKIGIFTGCMALLLGACITNFDDWHFERGRWKQTALFFVIGIVGYFVFLYAQIQDVLTPPKGSEAAIAVDVAFATALAWKQLRFLLTKTRLNWLITKLHPAESKSPTLPWIYTLAAQPSSHGIPRTI